MSLLVYFSLCLSTCFSFYIDWDGFNLCIQSNCLLTCVLVQSFNARA